VIIIDVNIAMPNTVPEMRYFLLFEALKLFHGGFNRYFDDYAMTKIYSTENLLKHKDVFKNSGMEKVAEPLLNSMKKINEHYIDEYL